jgi:hypothetical protein
MLRSIPAESGDSERRVFSQTHIRPGAVLREDRGVVVAMREGNQRRVLDPDGNRCFDLSRDPFELESVECDSKGIERVARWFRTIEEEAVRMNHVSVFEVSPEQRSHLESLEYGA